MQTEARNVNSALIWHKNLVFFTWKSRFSISFGTELLHTLQDTSQFYSKKGFTGANLGSKFVHERIKVYVPLDFTIKAPSVFWYNLIIF